MVITDVKSQNAGPISQLKPRKAETSLELQQNLPAPADTATIGSDKEPELTANEYKWLKMIKKEEYKKAWKSPITLIGAGFTGMAGFGFIASTPVPAGSLLAMQGLSVGAVPGLGAAAIIGLGAAMGVGVLLTGMLGSSSADDRKKEWTKTFVQNSESESLKKLIQPYPDLYMKITKGEVA